MPYLLRRASGTLSVDPTEIPKRRKGGLGVAFCSGAVDELMPVGSTPDEDCLLVSVDGRARKGSPGAEQVPLLATLALPDGRSDVIAVTTSGMALRVRCDEVGPRWSRLARLTAGDSLSAVGVVPTDDEQHAAGSDAEMEVRAPLVLFADARGGAILVGASSIRTQSRGGVGSRRLPTGIRSVNYCLPGWDLMMVSAGGRILRMAVSELRVRGWGARRPLPAMKLREEDQVVGVGCFPTNDD